MLTRLAGARILLVEDHDSLREDLLAILESEGYQVKAAASGLEALELAAQHTFELVVSDVRMAGMDGLEAIERLQKHYGHLATLVITGYTADADSIRAVRLGVGDYLKKPFELSEFLAVVARLLRNHLHQQLQRQNTARLRKTAGWALQELYQQRYPQSSPPAHPRLAQALAEELALPEEAAWHSQALSWLQLCRQAGPLSSEGLPDDLRHLLQELEDPEGSPSLPAQIAQVSLGQIEVPELLRPALERVQSRGLQQLPADPQRPLRLRRSQAQEKSHPGEAQVGYQRVVDEGLRDQAELEALLGLLRLQQHQPEACLRWGEAAVSLARQLHGQLAMATSLEVGLVLLRNLGAERARPLFEATGRLARELASPLWQAKALLALRCSGQVLPPEMLEQALDLLTSVDQRIELLSSADWLAPGLLKWASDHPSPLVDKALTLIGRDAPGALLQADLPRPLRQAMVAYLPANSLVALEQDPDPDLRQAALQRRGSSSPEAARPPLLRIHALGAFEVLRGNEPLTHQALKSLKQRFLLCRLALAGRPLQPDTVVEEFWPDSLESGRSSLNVCVSNLRKALKVADWPLDLDYLKRDATGLWLNPELDIWIDAGELLQLLEAQPEPDRPEWKRALTLYRGPFLEDCYMDWALSLRQTLEIRITRCLIDWLNQKAAPERAAETLDYAQRLLALDDCSQEGYLAAMRAHLWQNRPEWSIRTFETAQKVLQRELGAEPGLPLLEAFQRARLSLP